MIQNYMDSGKMNINVFSMMNPWMDATFKVDPGDGKEAFEVLEKAWDSYWTDEDAADQCYGDWLEWALDEAGIEYEVEYAPDDEDEEEW